MVVGHTKFSCDRAFGVLKKKLNLTELWTLYDIVDAVYKSGECNHPELVGFHDGRVAVKTYNWSEKLSLFFKKIDNITTCLLYTSPSPRDKRQSRMPSSA